MSMKSAVIGTMAVAILAVSPVGAAAQTAKSKAIDSGAKQLTSMEIAKLVVGKTVTARAGKKRFLFHYSTDNVLSGKLIGGKWSGSGFYGITDDDRICISMGNDKGRLRCLTLLSLNGAVSKYDVKGARTFELLAFEKGNHM